MKKSLEVESSEPVATKGSDIREAFEYWYSDEGKSPRAVARIGGHYELMRAQSSWIAWQACWNQTNEACQRLAVECAEARKAARKLVDVAEMVRDAEMDGRSDMGWQGMPDSAVAAINRALDYAYSVGIVSAPREVRP